MPTNPATLPVTPRRAPPAGEGAANAALAARSAGLSLNGLSSPSIRSSATDSFPNLLADALQGADPAVASSLLSGVGADALTGATLPSLAGAGNAATASPLAGIPGLAGIGTSALGGALSGLGNLAAMFGVGSTTAPISPSQRQAGERAVETALGYLGRYDWNNYCERFVEVCYGTRNRFPNAASAGRALVTHRGLSALQTAPVGAILYFAANAGNQMQGHAGLYLGDGRMVSATPSGVKMERVDSPAYSGQFVGWAEPGSLAKGRANGTGADLRLVGTGGTPLQSRTQGTSRLGSVVPPTMPRVGGAAAPAQSIRSSAAATTGSVNAVGARGAASPTASSPRVTGAATANAMGPATLPILPGNAAGAAVARPVTSAAAAAPPLPLTARAVANLRAPLGLGTGNPLSPLAGAAGTTLNRRA